MMGMTTTEILLRCVVLLLYQVVEDNPLHRLLFERHDHAVRALAAQVSAEFLECADHFTLVWMVSAAGSFSAGQPYIPYEEGLETEGIKYR